MPIPHWTTLETLHSRCILTTYFHSWRVGKSGENWLLSSPSQRHTKAFFFLSKSWLTETGIVFIWEIAHEGCGDSIAELSDEKCEGSCRSVDNCGEEEEKIVEPAGSSEIIEAMAHSVSPDLGLAQRIKFILGRIFVRVGTSFSFSFHVLWLLSADEDKVNNKNFHANWNKKSLTMYSQQN